MKRLKLLTGADHCRFWGMFLGISRNYFILEVSSENSDPIKKDMESVEMMDPENTNKNEIDAPMDLPRRPDWKPSPIIKSESTGSGLNRFSYYVVNELSDKWIQLPDVSPCQIQTSRFIKKLLTGDLEASFDVYPPFPGVEKNYLRALIARISGSTLVSPAGFFQTENEDDEESDVDDDELEGRFDESVSIRLEECPDFEPMTLDELIDPNLSTWVHHSPYVLNQGRATWWNPRWSEGDKSATTGSNASTDRSMNETEEEYDEENDELVETGPPILSPIGDDAKIDGQPAWSLHVSSRLMPELGCAVVRSNRWPGACSIGVERYFSNLYIGWGIKYTGSSFSPRNPPPPLYEYPPGPELDESDDPTVEAEEEARQLREEQARQDREVESVDAESEEDDTFSED